MLLKSLLSASALIAVSSAAHIHYMLNCNGPSGNRFSEIAWYGSVQNSQHGEQPDNASAPITNGADWVHWEGNTITGYFNDGTFEVTIRSDGSGGGGRN